MIKTKTWIKIIVSFFAICLGLCFFLSSSYKDGDIAEIVSDGALVERVDLKDKKERTLRIENQSGYNIIQIKGGDLYVIEADCSEHSCMKTGSLKKSGMIVCLPHHLIITLKNTDIDGVSR